MAAVALGGLVGTANAEWSKVSNSGAGGDDFTGYVIDYGTFPDQRRPYFTLRDARLTLATATKAAGLEGATEGFMKAAIWGTPDRILRELESRRDLIGEFELNVSFRFGGTPFDVSKRSIALFAKEVLPVVHSWGAEAKAKGYEGEMCGECGNFTLVRNGTCMKCDTCGSTTGCS